LAEDDLATVGLYVTCLVDLFRPVVGFAAIKLLQEAGCEVKVPLEQTCCGQPAYNSGDRKHARALAMQVIDRFEKFDYVVAPSGSCAGMLKTHYPELFKDDPVAHKKALEFSAKVHELVSFLVDIRGLRRVEAGMIGRITYHDACAGLREMGVKQQPRLLLGSMPGTELREMEDVEACCGFGGTFCVKYPEISDAMVGKKCETITATGADVLLAGDLGCLMNMAGKLSRDGWHIEVRHVAEVLAGMCEEPPIAGMQNGAGEQGNRR
jgi:L-lactate dehydrogenase complex protein LldE